MSMNDINKHSKYVRCQRTKIIDQTNSSMRQDLVTGAQQMMMNIACPSITLEALNLVSTHSWLYHQYLVCMEVLSQFFSSSVVVNIFVRLRVVATSQGNSWSSFKFQAPMYVTIFFINVY